MTLQHRWSGHGKHRVARDAMLAYSALVKRCRPEDVVSTCSHSRATRGDHGLIEIAGEPGGISGAAGPTLRNLNGVTSMTPTRPGSIARRLKRLIRMVGRHCDPGAVAGSI